MASVRKTSASSRRVQRFERRLWSNSAAPAVVKHPYSDGLKCVEGEASTNTMPVASNDDAGPEENRAGSR